MASFKRLRSKAFLIKTRKTSKDQEEILSCALQNGCSKIGKNLGKRQCRSPVLEMLSCYFIKTGLHLWHDWLEKMLICLISQIFFCFGRATVEVYRKYTVIDFRILVKSLKLTLKITGKNLLWSSLVIKLQSLPSVKENSITSVFQLILLNFSKQLL